LKTLDSSGKQHVQSKDMARFRGEYVSPRDLARDVGTAPQYLLRLIGVRPAADPGMDANRQYFFGRADLAGLSKALGNFAFAKLGSPSEDRKEFMECSTW
jgi:hypothetical protein